MDVVAVAVMYVVAAAAARPFQCAAALSVPSSPRSSCSVWLQGEGGLRQADAGRGQGHAAGVAGTADGGL